MSKKNWGRFCDDSETRKRKHPEYDHPDGLVIIGHGEIRQAVRSRGKHDGEVEPGVYWMLDGWTFLLVGLTVALVPKSPAIYSSLCLTFCGARSSMDVK